MCIYSVNKAWNACEWKKFSQSRPYAIIHYFTHHRLCSWDSPPLARHQRVLIFQCLDLSLETRWVWMMAVREKKSQNHCHRNAELSFFYLTNSRNLPKRTVDDVISLRWKKFTVQILNYFSKLCFFSLFSIDFQIIHNLFS